MAILNPTPRDEALLAAVKNVMPCSFIADAGDDKIIGFVDLVINDLNWWHPVTNYTRADFPENWTQTIVLGANIFAQLFKQMDATLQDFGYNDAGLSISIDQVGKIQTSHDNMLKIYSQQAQYVKHSLLLGYGKGLGTPRFQSQIGQFLKIALGGSFNWGNG